MPSTKEIRLKIKSVQNTRKITKAMEMVAASKMRKAQDRMRNTRPYGDKIRNIVAHLALANPEYSHPFVVKRDEIRNVGLILISTDKGLCGGLNTNVQRAVLQQVKQWEGEGVKFEASALGNKGFGFLQRLNANIVAHAVQLGDKPHAGTAHRPGQGPARRLCGRPAGRRLHRLLALHQHDEAGAGDRAAAAAVGRALRADAGGEARLRVGLPVRARRRSA